MPRAACDIIQDLRQTNRAKRRKAINEFASALRRESFESTWEAVGHAHGLTSLMVEFSSRDLSLLCKRLAMTASAQQARSQRRAALGELVVILLSNNKDGRPLSRLYQNIIPACNWEVIKRFEPTEWTLSQKRCLLAGHEAKFLNDMAGSMSAQDRSLVHGNIPFKMELLTKFANEDYRKCPPDWFIDEIAMPLLKHQLKSRYDEETRNHYLQLVLQIVSNHEEQLAGQLSLAKGGLLQYIVDRWSRAGTESKQALELYLEQVIKLLPSQTDMGRIQQAICVSTKINYQEKYELFRLFLIHTKGCQIDIDSNSEENLSRLRKIPIWPASLFFSMDYQMSIHLFDKLYKLSPKGDFLGVERQRGTILNQSQGRVKHSPFGDVEVVKALLIRRSKTQNHPGWFQHSMNLVNERKTKAEQSREAAERAYWAISALQLCVATGDLTALKDAIVWSRRFLKDSATSVRLYSHVLRTREMEELLGAIPDGKVDSPEAAMAFTSSISKRDIELSNQILIEMATTAAMATNEPGFQAATWTWLFDLIESVAVDRRIMKLDVLFNLSKWTDFDRDKYQKDLCETVWKPTIDLLLHIQATCGGSAYSALYRESIKGIRLYQRLANPRLLPHLHAELTRFFIQQTKSRLGPGQIQSVVLAIKTLAFSSDQPQLACPFIRDLILDDDQEASSSSWHRQLLGPSFLSILPRRDAEGFLRTMGGAIREKMREQNHATDLREEEKNPEKKVERSSRKPGAFVKVTTVKMLAQLLQRNLFIDPSSSCEILVGLLSEARHIDIRNVILKSLLDTMEDQGCPSNIRDQIFAALEEYVVPVVSQLNERRGLTESDWAMALEGGPLPVIGQASLLDLLIERTRLAKLDKSRLAQLVMGAIERSAANNTRWLNLFMVRNNFSLNANENLPKLPVHLVQLSKAFTQLMPYTPKSLYKMVEEATLNNIEPSSGIKAITKAIQEDRELFNSDAGKHWLSQFSSDNVELNRHNIQFVPFNVAVLLQQGSEHRDSKLNGDGVSRAELQTLVIQCSTRMLVAGQAGQIVSLVRRLCAERLKSRENWETWHANCLPVIETIILKTKEAQTRQFTEMDERHMLPNIFTLRMMTLPIPLPDATEEEEKTFVEGLYELIENLAGRQNYPYHTDLERLKAEVNNWPLTQSFGRFAIDLATVQGYNLNSKAQPSLVDYLRWEIVGHLLSRANGPKEAATRVRELLSEWLRFKDEGIRTMGVNLERSLQNKEWLATN
ncbi:hypothetical protein FLONG3_7227 [Fusarium longipes]|uniref:Uncharacterized protein n=1 Tax=Fusarium longipes TaxID=694270 RepID=A0A395SG79_9HYPO|nr:hypothetical protein FLONG3_7227 [Fusarium longipes]